MVSNACGTIALVHSVANNNDRLVLFDNFPVKCLPFSICIADGLFKQLLDDSKNSSPEERGKLLQKSTQQLMSAHQELALEGQTEVCTTVNNHFVAFVHKDGFLYELDGRKDFPINHGSTTPEHLLEVFPGNSNFVLLQQSKNFRTLPKYAKTTSKEILKI